MEASGTAGVSPSLADEAVSAHGGSLTIDSISYTFDDTTQQAFIPVPSRYYRVRLAP
jgi:hypothetical protein